MTERERPRYSKFLPVVGWREWVALPGLGVPAIKAKVDTGARSSCLHAFDIAPFDKDGATWVRFRIHPFQRDAEQEITAEARVLEQRSIRSSTGHDQLRWVISTDLELMGRTWPIELTLTARDAMGFRMLLGRQAIRRWFVVHPGQSFLGGRPNLPKRKRQR